MEEACLSRGNSLERSISWEDVEFPDSEDLPGYSGSVTSAPTLPASNLAGDAAIDSPQRTSSEFDGFFIVDAVPLLSADAAPLNNAPPIAAANTTPVQQLQSPMPSTNYVEGTPAGIAAGVAALTLEPALDMTCYEDLFPPSTQSPATAMDAPSYIPASLPGVNMSGVSLRRASFENAIRPLNSRYAPYCSPTRPPLPAPPAWANTPYPGSPPLTYTSNPYINIAPSPPVTYTGTLRSTPSSPPNIGMLDRSRAPQHGAGEAVGNAWPASSSRIPTSSPRPLAMYASQQRQQRLQQQRYQLQQQRWQQPQLWPPQRFGGAMQPYQGQGYSQAQLWDPLQGMPPQQMPHHMPPQQMPHQMPQSITVEHAMTPEHQRFRQQLFQELQHHPSYQQQQLEQQRQGADRQRQAEEEEQRKRDAAQAEHRRADVREQQRQQAAMREQQQVEAALEASAADYRARHKLAADAEIRLPLHEQELHRVAQQSAEPLMIQHDGYVTWQNEPQVVQGIATGSAPAASVAAASGWLPSAMDIDDVPGDEPMPKGWPSSARVANVQATDSVARFAKRHGCSYKEVAALNGFQMTPDGALVPCVLYPRQVLQLPDTCKSAESYASRLGAHVDRIYAEESMEHFAQRHGTYVHTVLAVNGLTFIASPKLQSGQVLQLP